MADEIELKLGLTREAADALDAAGFWPGEPSIANQRSIYFDTPDGALVRAGLSLRIRRSGHKRVQTVKAKGGCAGGLFVRSEWERGVESDKPLLDDTTPVLALIGNAADAILPAFTVKVERRTWMIVADGSSIEAVFDCGEVVSGDRSTPIHEIELELKEGQPSALFHLARRIDAVAPVRLGVQSKSERGYRLADAALPAFKADEVGLRSDLTAAEAFARVASACLRHYRLNEDLLLATRSADALHQARVALRRLRSAFSLFKPMMGGERHVPLRAELRWLAGELGAARNLDVLIKRSKEGPVHDRLVEARGAAYDRVIGLLSSDRVRALMLDVAEWIAVGDWLQVPEREAARVTDARSFGRNALDRFRCRVKKGGRDLRHASDEARHALRKNAKKLRYGAEFFAGLYHSPRERRCYKKFVAALEHLQDELGDLNDLATAPTVIEELGFTGDPDAARLVGRGKRKAMLSSAAKAHNDLVDAKRFWR